MVILNYLYACPKTQGNHWHYLYNCFFETVIAMWVRNDNVFSACFFICAFLIYCVCVQNQTRFCFTMLFFFTSFRQYYTYIVDKRCKRLGSQAWVFVCIAVSELILNIKFGKDLFSNTQYMKIVTWFFVIALTSLLGILASMKYYRHRYPVEVTEETTSVENLSGKIFFIIKYYLIHKLYVLKH